MNRKERRQKARDIWRESNGKVKFKQALAYMNENYRVPFIQEGQVVKLNYELMKRDKEWKFQSEEFRTWVIDHKDETFTVEWEPERKEKNSEEKGTFVNLKEDTTEPKWIFRSDCLIPIAFANIKLDNGEEKKVILDGVTDANDPKVQEEINKALE